MPISQNDEDGVAVAGQQQRSPVKDGASKDGGKAAAVATATTPAPPSTTTINLSSLPHYRFLKQATIEHPLNIVIIHGDPTKPNDILPGGRWDEDDFYTIQRAREALSELQDRYRFTWLCNHDTLMDDLRRLAASPGIDLVLQLCDEGWMNNSRMELHVVAFLEMLNIPYTGASPKCIGVTYDKQAVLKVAESIGVPVPKSVYVEEGAELDPSTYGLEWPIMVKPNSTDGSFGITQRNVCHNMDNLRAAMDEIRNVFHIRGPVLYQEYLTGRDVNVGVMEQRNRQTGEMEPQTLPITEEDYSALPEDLPKICGFESKWDESSPYYKIITRPTTLSDEAQRMVSQHSVRLFRRIDCHDYARFDWRLDGQGRPRLLEANPNCGWCWDGHLPKTAALCGVSYAQFFETIIKSGLDRAAKLAMQAEQNKVKKFINVGRNGAEELVKKAAAVGSSTSPTGSDMSIPEH